MTAVAIVGLSASVLSVINQFPQAIKIYKSQDTHSISLTMYTIIVLCISMWLLYGVLLNDGPLIWSNALSLVPILYIFTIKLRNTVVGKDRWSI